MNDFPRGSDPGQRSPLELVARDARRQHQAQLTRRVVRLMMVMVVLAALLASLEERNDPVITVVFYSPMVAFLGVCEWLIRRGRSRAAGWVVTTLFWCVVACATWFFGGLMYEMGTAYVISVVLAGATLGGRPAIGFGVASVIAASFVAWAQTTGVLPESLAPASITNAWISLSLSLLLAGFLLHTTVQSNQDAWKEAARSSQEKDEAQNRYLVAQKLEPIGRMASGVAHDFNNILNIITNVSWLLRDANREEREELLDELDAATKRGELMTRQLLAFNRKRELEMGPIELGELLSTITPVLRRLLGDDVRVDLRFPKKKIYVNADRGQLEQLIMNLAVNARDAMADGGLLSITCERSESHPTEIELEISDTGAGMDEETVGRVFEPFFSTKETGTGLGLATVKDVVARHGGRLDMRSTLGVGTTFRIVLPEDASGVEPLDSSQRPESFGHAGLRILLVEDEPNVRRSHGRLLEAMGHEVIAVGNGAEALSLVTTQAEIDLIVSDVSMPVMSGIELAQRLDRLGESPPVILVTGHLGEAPSELANNRVVAAFLTKPVGREQIERAIDGALGQRISRASVG